MKNGVNRMTNKQSEALLKAVRIIIKQAPSKKKALKHIKAIEKKLRTEKELTPNRDK